MSLTHKEYLQKFILEHMPLVIGQDVFHFVFRGTELLIVDSAKLRIGDIRLLSLAGKDLVTGLSDYEWSTLLGKFRALIGVVEYAVKNNIKRLED